MLTAFWTAVGGKLADRWIAVSPPALVFWLVGLAAWTYERGGIQHLGNEADWLDRQAAVVEAAVIVAVLLGVAASALLVGALAIPTLRVLEGYWPSWTSPLRRRLVESMAKRASAEAREWQRAYAAVQTYDGDGAYTSEQLAAYNRLERRRRRRPATPGDFLPTPIGNILRAAERRPTAKYGLDTITVWPRLWLVLPDVTRQELIAAHTSLQTAVSAAIWGLLFCFFAPFSALTIPIGLAVAAISVTVILPTRAQVFGDLIEATYDVHRTALYHALRWPLPANPAEERRIGQALTHYLARGSGDTTPTFAQPG